jgi:flagellin-like protein
MKNRIKFGKNEEAVSPVIGVILMVAITVILAAVIAAFVFGMGTPTAAPTASISITTASSATGNITIVHRGGDIIDLFKTKAIIEQGTGRNIINQLNGTSSQMFNVGDNLAINTSSNKVWLNNVMNSSALTTTGNFPLASGKVTVTLIDTDSSKEISRYSVTAS